MAYVERLDSVFQYVAQTDVEVRLLETNFLEILWTKHKDLGVRFHKHLAFHLTDVLMNLKEKTEQEEQEGAEPF